MNRDQWLSTIAPCALKMESLFASPPRVTFAHVMVGHAAMESGWGARTIGRFNCFGITLAERHTISVMKPTKEAFTDAQAEFWRKRYPDRPLRATDENGKPYGKIGNKTIYATVRPFADFPDLEAAARDWVSIVRGERGTTALKHAWTRHLATGDWKQWCREYLPVYASAGHVDPVIQIAQQRNVLTALEAAA